MKTGFSPAHALLIVVLAAAVSAVEAMAGRAEGLAAAQLLVGAVGAGEVTPGTGPMGLARLWPALQGWTIEELGLIQASFWLAWPWRALGAAGAWAGGAALGGARGGLGAALVMLAVGSTLDPLDPALAAAAGVAWAAGRGTTAARGIGVAAGLLVGAPAGMVGLLTWVSVVRRGVERRAALGLLGVVVGVAALGGVLPAWRGLPDLKQVEAAWLPLLGLMVVIALLVRGDAPIWTRLGQSVGAVLGGAVFPGHPTVGVAPIASLAGTRWWTPIFGLLAVGVVVTTGVWSGLLEPATRWPSGPDAPPLRAQALSWLAEHADRDGNAEKPSFDKPSSWVQVQLDADPIPGWSAPELQAVSWSLGLPLQMVGPDEPGDVTLVVVMPGGPSPRGVWRALLPPPTVTLPGPDTEIRLWDRPVPPESALLNPDPGQHHPSRQGLYVRLPDGSEQGPLLLPASSATLARGPTGWWVWFVRDQAVWRARSDDGLAWAAPEPTGIAGFDPDVQWDGAAWSLWVAELESGNNLVDPAEHPTVLRRYVGSDPTSLTLVEQAVSGLGRVDPAFRAPDELYFTEGRTSVRRARKTPAGWQDDPGFRLDGYTVPAPVGDWLLAQRHVASDTAIYALRRRADGSFGDAVPMEVCGSAPAVVAERLYYTRDTSDPRCGPPVAFPHRKAGVPWLSSGERPAARGGGG